MFCSNCGKPVTPDSLFCGSCGFKLNPVPQETPSANYNNPAYSQVASSTPVQSVPASNYYAEAAYTATVKSKSWLGWLIGGLSLVLVASFVFVFFFTNLLKSDEDLINERIEEFITSYNNGDMEAVMECFDQRTRSALSATIGIGESLLGSAAGFDVSMSDMFGLGAGLNEGDMMKLSNIQFTVPEGAVRVSVTAEMTMNASFMGYSQTQSSPVQFEMVKEDDDWFIANMITQ